MKKAIGLIFSLFLTLSLAISAGAEEFNGADLFTIDLPDGYEQVGTATSDYSFKKENGDSVSIEYVDNTAEENIFSPADMSKKEIDAYTSSLVAEAKELMEEYVDSFDMEFVSAEKIKHPNGKTALVCKMKTYITSGKEEFIYYQTMYEFGGVDYKYSFTYTTQLEKRADRFTENFETINIFEAETQTGIDKLTSLAGAGVLLLLVFAGIVRFIRTPEKRAKGKIK